LSWAIFCVLSSRRFVHRHETHHEIRACHSSSHCRLSAYRPRCMTTVIKLMTSRDLPNDGPPIRQTSRNRRRSSEGLSDRCGVNNAALRLKGLVAKSDSGFARKSRLGADGIRRVLLAGRSTWPRPWRTAACDGTETDDNRVGPWSWEVFTLQYRSQMAAVYKKLSLTSGGGTFPCSSAPVIGSH